MPVEKSQCRRVVVLVGITLSAVLGCDRATPEPSAASVTPTTTSIAGSVTPGAQASAAPTHRDGASGVGSSPTSVDLAANPTRPSSAPLRLAYVTEPGLDSWARVGKSGAFTRRGVTVQLSAFEHTASLEAYSAGRVDAVAATNVDALVNRSLGSPCTAIAITSVRLNPGVLFARTKITELHQLRDKKVGVELGQPEHLALERVLRAARVEPNALRLDNVVPEVAHRDFKARTLDAVVLPVAQAATFTKHVPDAHRVDDLENAPLIYGLLCVNPTSWAARRDEWTRVVDAWQDVVASQPLPERSGPSPRLVATVDEALHAAVMKATGEFDAFHVRTHAYGEPVFEAFAAHDAVWPH